MFTDTTKDFRLINVCLTYYNQGKALQKHIESWQTYPDEVLKHLRFVIIDDGSREDPALVNIHDTYGHAPSKALNIEIYKIREDIPWNIGGARNLAFAVSKGKWLFQLDMDTILPKESAIELVSFAQNTAKENIIYKFRQNHIDEQSQDDTHPGLMFLTKETFWLTGGHDEDFCGSYGGTDVHIYYKFEEVIEGYKYEENVEVYEKVRVLRLPIGEVNGLERNPMKNMALCDERRALKNWSKGILRFHWDKVL
jgi:glycosyltransferase involved in cell wall biosynthesis